MASARKPSGTHTVKEAADEFGISSRALYKKMRFIGWLNVERKGELKGSRHNTPQEWAIRAGYVLGYETSYKLKGTNVERLEVKPAVTPLGMEILDGIINRNESAPNAPEPKRQAIADVKKKPAPANKELAKNFLSNLHNILQ